MLEFGNSIRVRLTLTEEMLGTSSANPEIHKEEQHGRPGTRGH